MSFDSLANQTAAVTRKSSPTATNPAGLPTGSADTAVGTIKGRLKRGGARQVTAWAALGIDAEYEFITKSMDVRNGDVLTITDQFGRSYGTFQVVGGSFPYVGEGSIESYCNLPCKQISRTGVTS